MTGTRPQWLPSAFLVSSTVVSTLVVSALVVSALLGCTDSPEKPQIAFSADAPLSEDEDVAAALRVSLDGFLEPLRRGELSDVHTSPADRERYPFFFQSLQRGAQDAEPVVLKSYPLDDGPHLINVAFVNGAPDALALSRIVDLEAVPVEGRFQFRCPYERRTNHLRRRTIGDVTFRFSGSFDEARAAEFVAMKTKIEALQGRIPSPLQYDCFSSLDDLLKAHGLVHDASKCNFLLHDLGFLFDNGRRFATGTGDENYAFGYVSGVLSNSPDEQGLLDEDASYRPYVTGVATYFGGYGLSGDSITELARQFRDELKRRPSLDFLEEFKKGRGSSIQRHFSHYVMCAFLCQEIATRHGEEAILRPVKSGANGERFFDELSDLLGITEENLHDSIVQLIQPPSADR